MLSFNESPIQFTMRDTGLEPVYERESIETRVEPDSRVLPRIHLERLTAGELQVWGNLKKRNHHKRTVRQLRMGQLEVALVDGLDAIEKKV